MVEQIGFIGLGIMGKPMARNLMTAGYEVTVYDIVGEAVEELATDGAKTASSSEEVASVTDTIITMLPDSADSEKVIEHYIERAWQALDVIPKEKQDHLNQFVLMILNRKS